VFLTFFIFGVNVFYIYAFYHFKTYISSLIWQQSGECSPSYSSWT